MKGLRWILGVLTAVVLLSVSAGAGRALPPEPRTPLFPPHAHQQSPMDTAVTVEQSVSSLDLEPLKAVLLVGPIDGDYGSWTTQEKENMDLVASELEANGVTVFKFYTPNNDWEQIKEAANGAHWLLYRGHGVYWSPMPYPTVGGFALKNRFVSSDDIRNDLSLAPNAIVMLYGCFTAGSSSIDDGLSSQEAQRRVAQYSDPFFDIGAAGYYADWFGNAFQMFVRYLYEGQTLGEAYESYFDFNSTTVERYVHPDHPALAMWLDKDYWDGQTQYNNAFAGHPDKTLTDLFGVTRMVVSPSAITYLAEPSFPVRGFTIHPTSTSTDVFDWTATVTPAGAQWIEVQPMSGQSGHAIEVTVDPTNKAVGTYQVDIHIAADSPDVLDGDQSVHVVLRVLDRVHSAYLPMVYRAQARSLANMGEALR